jgi:hypothetical protein
MQATYPGARVSAASAALDDESRGSHVLCSDQTNFDGGPLRSVRFALLNCRSESPEVNSDSHQPHLLPEELPIR